MPRGTPISFEEAAGLATAGSIEAFQAGRIGYEPGECGWYKKNFVEWITSLGYHIEITGDEFEAYAMTDKLA